MEHDGRLWSITEGSGKSKKDGTF
jgi:hypothetical protein